MCSPDQDRNTQKSMKVLLCRVHLGHAVPFQAAQPVYFRGSTQSIGVAPAAARTECEAKKPALPQAGSRALCPPQHPLPRLVSCPKDSQLRYHHPPCTCGVLERIQHQFDSAFLHQESEVLCGAKRLRASSYYRCVTAQRFTG